MAAVISSFLELSLSPSFDTQVEPTVKPPSLGSYLDFKIAKSLIGWFMVFLGTEIHLTYIGHDFFP